MARRNKRASMREGPLSDLFRSTADDAPMDPPEAPRYGRQDPADAKKAQDEGGRDAGPVDAGDPPSPAEQETVPPTTPPAAEAAPADAESSEPVVGDEQAEEKAAEGAEAEKQESGS
jgi:hypothetical protein